MECAWSVRLQGPTDIPVDSCITNQTARPSNSHSASLCDQLRWCDMVGNREGFQELGNKRSLPSEARCMGPQKTHTASAAAFWSALFHIAAFEHLPLLTGAERQHYLPTGAAPSLGLKGAFIRCFLLPCGPASKGIYGVVYYDFI